MFRPSRREWLFSVLGCAAVWCSPYVHAADTPVDTSSLRGKILAGYQGWFRCPGDAAGNRWVHWSRDGKRIAPETVTFEMWPETSEYPADGKFAAGSFTHPDGSQAYLFTSDHAGVVRTHFEWMKKYGLDGVWLQHFVVELPGAPGEKNYPTRRRVMEHVRAAAKATGRAWALEYDMTGVEPERAVDAICAEWQVLEKEGVFKDDRYIREGGKPVVQVFGFYPNTSSNHFTVAAANRLIDFFKARGVFIIGGGEWAWRKNSAEDWRAVYRKLNGFSPWNIGNYSKDKEGIKHAATGYWADDLKECEANRMLWFPVVYPGFGWNNLKRDPSGKSVIDRRKGAFLWEQFAVLSKMGVGQATVAMFDEVDEGTAIFKISPTPPQQAPFQGTEGMPSDWYLRLVGETTRLLHSKIPVPAEIPIKP